jgi:carbamoyltransferase
VINPSFSVKNQPIIRDPATAVRSFAGMASDRLYIEGFRIQPPTAHAVAGPLTGRATATPDAA